MSCSLRRPFVFRTSNSFPLELLTALRRLFEAPNVHILGEKPHQELKRYLTHIDVALIPFQYHPITLATNPVKAYEYLASGVRVLSTALPECIAMEPHVTTATTHDDFLGKLSSMLHQPNTEEHKLARIAYARESLG